MVEPVFLRPLRSFAIQSVRGGSAGSAAPGADGATDSRGVSDCGSGNRAGAAVDTSRRAAPGSAAGVAVTAGLDEGAFAGSDGGFVAPQPPRRARHDAGVGATGSASWS